MKRSTRGEPLTRRQFLRQNLGTAAWIGVGGAWAASAVRARAAAGKDQNPFAYDVGRYEKTDPKLVHYRETARFRTPRPEPRRLALGPGGQLYLAAGNYVSRLSPAGAVLSEIALSAAPRCLAVAKDGLLYVGLRDHVEVYDAKDQRRGSWDPPGKKPWLTGLALNDTELIAADAGGRVLLRYDRSGKLLGRIGERDKERDVPGFILPSPYFDVEWPRDGLLRVNNPGRHRVEAYTVDGDFELAWGKPSAGIEGFCGCCNPINLALLPDGRVVTCEKGLPRVKVYSAHGEFECVVAGTESFPENAKVGAGEGTGDGVKAGLDAVVDEEGRVYILDFVAGDIRVMVHSPPVKA